MILALAGGVGGARLARGLAAVLPPEELTVVVNTGDDFEHLGLHVSPDIDTVTYTLAGIGNAEQGWGLAGETWAFMAALKRLGGEDWFNLGDQDLAIHVERTGRLRAGEPLSAITADFATKLGIAHRIVPMTDDRVATKVETDRGQLDFQHYFVRERCVPVFRALVLDGIETARPAAQLLDPEAAAIILCPSNPVLSIAPILALPGVAAALRAHPAPKVAVSPFIGGQAVKGPAGKIMAELGRPVTPQGLADSYDGLLDGVVIDHADAALPCSVPTFATDTLMRGPEDQARLAAETLAFARSLR